MSEKYLPYNISDNPFPFESSLTLNNPDKRFNGNIFNYEIYERELGELMKRLRRRTNLVYCQDTSEFMRGVGKSAIIAHTYRKLLREEDNVTSVYIRSQKPHKPSILCAQIIKEWQRQGFLWSVLTNCLEGYINTSASPEIRPEGARLLIKKNWPVDRVDLRAHLCYNPSRLMTSLADWASTECTSLSPEIASVFFSSYLSAPRDFITVYPKELRKLGLDDIDMLRNTLELLSLGSFEYHYIFLDQFEDPIYGLRGKELIQFSSEMRRFLEAGIGRMSIIVTLNSSAATTLATPEGQEFTTLAPLDKRHIINVDQLEPQDAEALAITYLQEFRTEIAADLLFPLMPEAIRLIHDKAEGVIRKILTGLNLCIEEGIDAGYPSITLEFLQSKHEEIIGQISPERTSLG